eukprot:1460986-Amphidinium_carterae.2
MRDFSSYLEQREQVIVTGLFPPLGKTASMNLVFNSTPDATEKMLEVATCESSVGTFDHSLSRTDESHQSNTLHR